MDFAGGVMLIANGNASRVPRVGRDGLTKRRTRRCPAVAKFRTFAPLGRSKQNQAVSVARISVRKGRELDFP
jgi:hypothetical protein